MSSSSSPSISITQKLNNNNKKENSKKTENNNNNEKKSDKTNENSVGSIIKKVSIITLIASIFPILNSYTNFLPNFRDS